MDTFGGGLAPCGITADPSGDVWVANCFPPSSGEPATIVRVDAKTLRLKKTWRVPGGPRFFQGIGYGDGSVWVSDRAGWPFHSTVIRINPQTGGSHSIHVPYPAGAFAWDAAHGDMWTNNIYSRTMTRLDAKSEASAVIRTATGRPVFPAVADGAVWVGDWLSPQVDRVDTTGSRTPRVIDLNTADQSSAGVWNVAAGGGYVWATTPSDGTLWRINPHTNAVTRIPISDTPIGVTANAGSIWVTVRGPTPPITKTSVGIRHCAPRDMRMTIEARGPYPAATVVLSNVSDRGCLAEGAPFRFTILDRIGRITGDWDDHGETFTGWYLPGGQRAYSLPAVYTCNRRGPFTAVAIVGRYTARRHGLRKSQITCL